jgi:aspartate kinase
MKVYKFGGASVNSFQAVKNAAEIIKKYKDENLLVVISAMGKTTNALEKLTNSYFYRKNDTIDILEEIRKYHFDIIYQLFENKTHNIYKIIEDVFNQIFIKIKSSPSEDFDYEYDQLVSYGEIISTLIVHNYLSLVEIDNKWIDARKIIITDKNYREANVNWEITNEKINESIIEFFNDKKPNIIVTQGFIGGTTDGNSVTLGREGSDYSAAIFAYCLNADEMIIWKDVEGVLNADPKFFENTQKLNAISYKEAIELAYYGASVIHPKTIKPLQNKQIPLFVKSFINPENSGTIISDADKNDNLIPSYIFKQNQILISISPNDFSFINEHNLSEIFNIISNNRIKINLMQNSAISFSICIDNDERRVNKLIDSLSKNYKVKYNKNLQLITIRHYNQKTIDFVVQNKKILLEQKSRVTAQIIVEN